jgi:L-lactate dehydrogenase (cytochrome)
MVFDYIDGAAGSGYGEELNRKIMQHIRLQPRVMCNVEKRSLSVKVFGEDMGLPFGVSPMGMCNLSAPGADLMLARLAIKHNIPCGLSTVGSSDIETMARASEGRAWFQLYFGGDEEQSISLIERSKAAGYKTLVIGADVPEVGRRPRELRRGFKMPFRIGPLQFIDFAMHPYWSLTTTFRNLPSGKPEMANFSTAFKTSPSGKFDRTASRAGVDWDLLKRVRDRWPGNLVVKGVLSPQDAVTLKDLGVDAVQVSSHGGRQLESAPAPILALGAIRKAVGPDYPLFYDSGIRGGEDIVKAYAMGANFVFLGRPFQFAIAGMGEDGLAQLTEVLAQETSITLAQLGVCDMRSVNESVISDLNVPLGKFL